MNCTHCGYNSDGDFCPNCGTPMSINQQNNNYNYENNQNSYNQQQYNDNNCPPPQQQYGQNQYNQPYNDQQHYNSYDNNGYNNESYGNMNNNNNKNNNNVIVAIISVAAVIIIGLVAALIVTTMNKTEKETTTTTSTPTTTQATMGTAEYDADVNAAQQTSGLVHPDYSISGTYYVTADVGLVLRKGPGTNYGKILTVKYGHSVVARGASYNTGDWYYVQYSGKCGWVNTQYLSSYKPSPTTKSNIYEIRWYDVSFTKYVNPREGLNLRKGASKNSGKVVLLPQDSMCIVMGESAYDNNWVYVNATTPDGYKYSGFVNRNYLYP